jgi:hypothetical protein
MFRVVAKRLTTCDGLSRRTFLTAGSLAARGLYPGVSATASARAVARDGFGRARRCLLLFLTGGPPQHDTWDLKPDAPAEVRGELKPIATSVPGLRVSELFPRLARHADKYCVVRSVTHGDTVHTSAGYTMLTGAPHPLANSATAALIRVTPDDHPHLGAVLAKSRGPRPVLPTAVSLPEFIRDAGVNDFPGQGAGCLGKAYAPLLVEADEARRGFRPPEVVLPPDVTADRLAARGFLRGRLDRALGGAPEADAMEEWQRRAVGLLRSPGLRRAFELDREPDRVRASYGQHLFGQGCLLARRLLEAGVAFVTVYWHYEGPDDSPVWDTHGNNFKHLRERLMPPTDQALAALLADLAARGLLDDTLVVCLGEFGRTPRINKNAGRDHWPHVQSVVLAGAGVRGGSVHGASDRHGAYPADQPVTPADLAATVLHLLGVPPNLELMDRLGRPLRACSGRPVLGVLR